MTPTEIIEIVEQVTYKPGWTIVSAIDGNFVTVQIDVDATTEASLDSARRDGTRTPWRSGKKYLTTFMCRQEIVGALFGMLQDAESHEMREWFRWRGRSIYNPHIDPLALWQVAGRASSFNLRDNAMTMVEA